MCFNPLPYNPDLFIPKKEVFENFAGKGENAGHQQLLLFPQCLLSKNLALGKELKDLLVCRTFFGSF